MEESEIDDRVLEYVAQHGKSIPLSKAAKDLDMGKMELALSVRRLKQSGEFEKASQITKPKETMAKSVEGEIIPNDREPGLKAEISRKWSEISEKYGLVITALLVMVIGIIVGAIAGLLLGG